MPARTPHLRLVVGPMFSGKSSYLLHIKRKYEVWNKRVLVVTHKKDERYGMSQKVVTHNLDNCDALAVEEIFNVYEHIRREKKKGRLYDLVLIDEGQFFHDLYGWTPPIIEEFGCSIVVAALVSNYQKKPYSQVVSLLAEADKIVLLRACCSYPECDRKAPFTSRRKDFSQDNSATDVVGAGDIYQSFCREHWQDHWDVDHTL